MARATAQDETLSFAARGMLAYLLSKPSDWQVQIDDLQQECGRDKVYGLIKELMQSRYVERKISRDERHRVKGVNYTVRECPLPEKPDTASPDTANTDSNTYNRQEENTENSNTFASASAAARADALAEELDAPIKNKALDKFKAIRAANHLALKESGEPQTPHSAPPPFPQEPAFSPEGYAVWVASTIMSDRVTRKLHLADADSAVTFCNRPVTELERLTEPGDQNWTYSVHCKECGDELTLRKLREMDEQLARSEASRPSGQDGPSATLTEVERRVLMAFMDTVSGMKKADQFVGQSQVFSARTPEARMCRAALGRMAKKGLLDREAPDLASYRLNDAGRKELYSPTPKTTPARKPQTALTDAMWKAIPEKIRVGKPHYGKNDAPARELLDDGVSAERIAAYVVWAYENDKWFKSGGPLGSPIVMTMHDVKKNIKPAELIYGGGNGSQRTGTNNVSESSGGASAEAGTGTGKVSKFLPPAQLDSGDRGQRKWSVPKSGDSL